MRFRLLSGRYYQGEKRFEKGEIIESNRDLCTAFLNKFERLNDVQEIIPDKEQKPADALHPPLTGGVKVENIAPPVIEKLEEQVVPSYGEDVTEDFSTAEKLNLKVFLKEDIYSIVDENGNKINEKTIISSNRVNRFLRKKKEGLVNA